MMSWLRLIGCRSPPMGFGISFLISKTTGPYSLPSQSTAIKATAIAICGGIDHRNRLPIWSNHWKSSKGKDPVSFLAHPDHFTLSLEHRSKRAMKSFVIGSHCNRLTQQRFRLRILMLFVGDRCQPVE